MTSLAMTYDPPAAVTLPKASFATARLAVVSSFAETATWQREVERRLNRLTKLPTGWDGYQAQRVSPLTASFVWTVLTSVMTNRAPTPSVVPVTGGGLQIEWHRNGLDIELYVSKPMKAELFVKYADERPHLEVDLTSDFDELSTALAYLA